MFKIWQGLLTVTQPALHKVSKEEFKSPIRMLSTNQLNLCLIRVVIDLANVMVILSVIECIDDVVINCLRRIVACHVIGHHIHHQLLRESVNKELGRRVEPSHYSTIMKSCSQRIQIRSSAEIAVQTIDILS